VSSLPLTFQVGAYDGPLDLLLDLIRKQQINIYDIPIATITSQYLEYMEKAASLDVELSSEFVYMAATLIHIKSRTLLPRDPELDKISPEDDPRQELVEKLLEHERLRNAAEMLQQKRVIEEAVWSNPRIQDFLSEDDQPGLAVSLFDLVKTFQQVLDRAKNRPTYDIEKEDVSVPDTSAVSLGKFLFDGTKTEMPRWYVDGQEALRAHPQPAVPTVAAITARPATTFLEWVRAHQNLFQDP